MEPSDPPFRSFYKKLFDNHSINAPSAKCNEIHETKECEFELPLIDLSRLNDQDGEDCKREIAEAAQEWGFFQVVNHGVSWEILEKMRCEQMKLFKKPFEEKVSGLREFDFLAGSYRWGTPSATCLRQLAWTEAFHVPLTEISSSMGGNLLGNPKFLSIGVSPSFPSSSGIVPSPPAFPSSSSAVFRITDMIGLASDEGGNGHLNILLGVPVGDGHAVTASGHRICHGPETTRVSLPEAPTRDGGFRWWVLAPAVEWGLLPASFLSPLLQQCPISSAKDCFRMVSLEHDEDL
ncbi:hypothetical protein L1987_28397 [Smallanthus sonchifolius]|uniref:Uncharacterized protein n=1 Tax=Smallanthus sonchifolius TaxID=185202 RepID=A0ACB9HX37_9ASTR|nr:hypothetical protein L1987_28397 [Smallanthus sonchifolius]